MSVLPEPYWQDESRGLRLFHGDCREVCSTMPSGSVGGIVTDPPYRRQDLPWYEWLFREAGRLLADGGSLLVFVPQYAMPEVFSMPNDLPYRWTFAMRQTKHPRLPNGHLFFCVTQKLIGWWQKKPWDWPRTRVVDSFTVAEPTKTWHPWEQPVGWAKWCFDLLPEGRNVLDPFGGSGTVLVAAAETGRTADAIEVVSEHCAMTVARLTEDLTYGPPNLFNQQETQ